VANATSILINVGAKTAPAITGLNKVNTALEKQDKAASGWSKSLKTFAKAGAVAFAAVGAAAVAGVGLAIDKMIEFGREAYDDEQNARKLDQTLKKIGFSDEQLAKNREWIASMELATLVSDDQLRVAVGRLTAQTDDYALAQQEAILAADLATGANISYEKALKAIQSANDGTTTSLGKYVKLVDKNKDGTISLKEATDALTDAYGGAAEAAANTDPWKRIGVLWGNMREALGQWLLPLMDRLAAWFKSPDNRDKVNKFIEKMGELSRMFGEKLVNAIKDFYKWLQSPDGQKAMKDMKEAADSIAKALKSMNDWLLENKDSMRLFGAVVQIQTDRIKLFFGAISTAVGWLKTLWEWMKRVGGSSLLKLALGARGLSATSTSAVRSLSAAPRAASGSSATINLYGAATSSDARVIKRALEGYDVSQGRRAGTPLRVAW
jgi:hypothetical protein